MRIWACDYSTRAVDIVTLPLDPGPPDWRHYPLTGPSALERCRQVRASLPGPGSGCWDDIVLAVLEEPRGMKRVSSPLFMILGALLQTVPVALDCWTLTATEWRRELGLFAGSDRKRQKREAVEYSLDQPAYELEETAEWTEDAYEAHCIALAARKMLDRGKTVVVVA